MSALTFADEAKLGRDAGWILAFHQITRDGIDNDPVAEFSRDDYYGDIAASLPGGLEGGSYKFTIEGLTDDDYDAIDQTRDGAPGVVRLYLYYRDLAQPDFGIGTNLLGSDFINAGVRNGKSIKHRNDLVAELRINSVARKAGSRKYETTIEAREMVFALVQSRRACGDPIDLKDPETAVPQLMQRAWLFEEGSVSYKYWETFPRTAPSPPAPPEDEEPDLADFRQPIISALQSIGARLEKENDLFGRGMLLIRNGKLHIGQRPIPLEGKPKKLTLSQGLLEATAIGTIESDPNWDLCKQDYAPPPARAQYKLSLFGRGDLKPGDVVVFDAPGEPSGVNAPLGGAFGAIGDLGASVKDTISSLFGDNAMKNPVQLYVNSVEHQLSRTSGFMTTLTGVQLGTDQEIQMEESRWDHHTPGADDKEPKERPTKASVAEQAADAVKGMVRREKERISGTDIAEIRTFRPAAQGTQAGQTSSVFRGTVPAAGKNQSRNAEIRRPSDAPAEGVPYLTPFAWGRCGLVLPRYPGMRVALTHNRHLTSEPIDMGAVWKSGHAPTEARSGDWWLSLPAEAPAGNAPPNDKSGDPEDYSGKVSDDLIDSSGNRIIQAGALVIRVGNDSLKPAGSRPADPPTQNSVTIEHPGSGAKIQMKPDGTIQISGANIQFQASAKVTIDAPDVVVSCQSMQVK